MLDLTTIILTYNEEIHIRRCLENISQFSKRIIVVDSPSTDRTTAICAEFSNVEVYAHKWPGNQAQQFNWTLQNIPINTEWVMRIDADEYWTDELIEEANEKIPQLPKSVSAIVLPLGRAFLGKVLKHEDAATMIRVFRNGEAIYDDSLMDEHLVILEGETISFKNKFIDDNRNTLSYFIDKHNKYSDKEAIQLLDAELDLFTPSVNSNTDYCDDVQEIKKKKAKYAKLPLFWRAIAYFFYRYFIQKSILDGKEGFLWCFFQGLWYRMLVDAKVYHIKRLCHNDRDAIKNYIIENYHYSA